MHEQESTIKFPAPPLSTANDDSDSSSDDFLLTQAPPSTPMSEIDSHSEMLSGKENSSQNQKKYSGYGFNKIHSRSNMFQVLNDDDEDDDSQDEQGAILFFSQHSASQARQSQCNAFISQDSESQFYSFTVYDSSSPFYVAQYRDTYINRLSITDSSFKSNTEFIQGNDRLTLIDWMISLCPILQIPTNSMFNAVNFLDRCFSSSEVKNKYLFAASCLSIASKMNSSFHPRADDYVKASDNKFTSSELTNAEMNLIKALNFDMRAVTEHNYIQIWANDIAVTSSIFMAIQFVSLAILLDPWFCDKLSELKAGAIFAVVLNTLGYKWDVEPIKKIIKKNGVTEFLAVAEKVINSVQNVTQNEELSLFKIFNASDHYMVTRYEYSLSTEDLESLD